MASFGESSRVHLGEADPLLQKLFKEVVKNYDCAVIEGYRDKASQTSAKESGKSTLSYPNSLHNRRPSKAVDVIPYPVDWNDASRFYHFAGYVQGIAEKLDIKIRWGGDWDSDRSFADQNFHDLPHFELV